jgi:hypothetical protein
LRSFSFVAVVLSLFVASTGAPSNAAGVAKVKKKISTTKSAGSVESKPTTTKATKTAKGDPYLTFAPLAKGQLTSKYKYEVRLENPQLPMVRIYWTAKELSFSGRTLVLVDPPEPNSPLMDVAGYEGYGEMTVFTVESSHTIAKFEVRNGQSAGMAVVEVDPSLYQLVLIATTSKAATLVGLDASGAEIASVALKG